MTHLVSSRSQNPPCAPSETSLSSNTASDFPAHTTPHLPFPAIAFPSNLPPAQSTTTTPKPPLPCTRLRRKLVREYPPQITAACLDPVSTHSSMLGAATPHTITPYPPTDVSSHPFSAQSPSATLTQHRSTSSPGIDASRPPSLPIASFPSTPHSSCPSPAARRGSASTLSPPPVLFVAAPPPARSPSTCMMWIPSTRTPHPRHTSACGSAPLHTSRTSPFRARSPPSFASAIASPCFSAPGSSTSIPDPSSGSSSPSSAARSTTPSTCAAKSENACQRGLEHHQR
eukprot:3353138-Rhodomonas_salina.1